MTKKSGLTSAAEALSKMKLKEDQRDIELIKNTQEVFPRSKQHKNKPGIILTKRVFWDLFNNHSKGNYIIDDRNKQVVFTIFNFFLKNPLFNQFDIIKSEPSLKKGLLIYGDYGIGKTWLFEILHSMGRELITNYGFKGLWFNKVSAGSFIEEYMQGVQDDNNPFDVKAYYKGKLYIDDLGFEKKAFNKTEVFGELLFERHRLGSITYVTTNLKPSEIHKRYGDRIMDRLPEMFNIIKWNGESFRK